MPPANPFFYVFKSSNISSRAALPHKQNTMNEVIIISKKKKQARKYFPHGKNRRVYLDEYGRIVYEYLTHSIKAYCTYNPVLFEILKDVGLSPMLDDRRGMRFKLQKKNSVIKNCKLSLLCQACYDGNITSIASWQKQYKKYRTWMRNFKYEVDHADSNQLNCTEYNLSVMSRKLNRYKDDITSRIRLPVICYCGHFGNTYRIRAFWPIKCKRTGEYRVWLRLKCESASDFVDCIREVADLDCGYGKPLRYLNENGVLEKVRTERWKEGRLCATTMAIENSLIGQAQTAWMFDCEFIPYNKGQVKKLFLDATI